MSKKYNYCDAYGYDRQGREVWLARLELGERDHALARSLRQEVIVPHCSSIIERLYDKLQTYERFREVMARGFCQRSLKHTQSDYLLTLGQDFDSAEYFEGRLAVGLVHARVGVPLSLYQCAYLHLQQILIDHIRRHVADNGERDRLIDFVLKITTLDISVAIETYHRTRMLALEDSLDTLQTEQSDLRKRAHTDPLTSVASRERLMEILQEALVSVNRRGMPLCLVMADLDYFKRVNDEYGHLAGDAVLRDVAARIRSALRDFDVVGRYGGEEFIIVLQNTELPMARQIIERVRERVAAAPINVQGLRVPVTISMGLAQARAGDRADLLIDRADRAMYAAKEAGRNCVMVAAGVSGG